MAKVPRPLPRNPRAYKPRPRSKLGPKPRPRALGGNDPLVLIPLALMRGETSTSFVWTKGGPPSVSGPDVCDGAGVRFDGGPPRPLADPPRPRLGLLMISTAEFRLFHC